MLVLNLERSHTSSNLKARKVLAMICKLFSKNILLRFRMSWVHFFICCVFSRTVIWSVAEIVTRPHWSRRAKGRAANAEKCKYSLFFAILWAILNNGFVSPNSIIIEKECEPMYPQYGHPSYVTKIPIFVPVSTPYSGGQSSGGYSMSSGGGYKAKKWTWFHLKNTVYWNT